MLALVILGLFVLALFSLTVVAVTVLTQVLEAGADALRLTV